MNHPEIMLRLAKDRAETLQREAARERLATLAKAGAEGVRPAVRSGREPRFVEAIVRFVQSLRKTPSTAPAEE